MRLFILSIAFSLSFFASKSYAFAKENVPDSVVQINTIVERAQLYYENFPMEKAHVHFDKPYYSVGDTVWFSTFLTSNLYSFEPSRVLYLEVLTSTDSLIQTFRIPLENLAGKGQVVLDPQVYKRDNYRFRAYSKYMGNFDSDYFFNKIIPVGDVLNANLSPNVKFNPENTAKEYKSRIEIELFDRFGNLLPNQRVNWDIIANYKSIGKGRTDTDVNGKLFLDLKTDALEKYDNAVLNLSTAGSGNNSTLHTQIPLKGAFFDVDLQFFPEGGELIANIPKKVGFKAVGTNGLGVPLKGVVVDKDGNTVTEFSSLHAGMGYFDLFPLLDHTYKAIVEFENGVKKEYTLPAVLKSGVSLVHHSSDDTHLRMAMVTNPEYLEANPDKLLYVFAQSNSYLCYAAQLTLKNESLLINIPLERLPNGIIQVLLTDHSGKPISERLVYVNANPFLDIQVKTDKDSYKQKDLVQLDLKIMDPDTVFSGTYSIAVTDESRVPYDDNEGQSIFTSFLLHADLKGHIEKPHYYFNPENENRLQALDALLLTQGYKRFMLQDFISQNYPNLVFLPESGIEVSGTLRLNTGRVVPNAGLLLSIPDRSFRTDQYTDEQGRFRFNNLVFTDSSRVTVNARGNDNYRNLVIHMDQTQYPGIDKNPEWPDIQTNIESKLQAYLRNSRQVFRTDLVLEEVKVVGTITPKKSAKDFSALTGLGMADHTIDPERLEGCRYLLQCLPTLLTGITYDSQEQKFYITRDYNAGGRIPAQVFLNGMPIDAISLNSLPADDIEGIEIFLKDELGTVSRMYQNNGVISFYTKSDHKPAPRMTLAEIERLLPKSNVVDLTPLGYIKEYTFYTPKYETAESKNVRDIRSTVYWNPSVKTDVNGEAKIQFYNGDGNGDYKIVIEGIDVTGNFGRKVLRYKVTP